MRLEVHIPRPPSVNGLFRDGGKGDKGRFKTTGYRNWIHHAGLVLNGQLDGWQTITGPVKISLTCDKRRGDLQNYDKAPLDLLTRHKVYEDDSQIVDLHLRHDPQCGDLMFIRVDTAL